MHSLPSFVRWFYPFFRGSILIAYYWLHRTGHEVRWTRAIHSVHHTPERIHLASAFRLGITEVHPVGSANPMKILFDEWRAIGHDVRLARSWRERRIFGRPGAWPIEKEKEEKAAIAVPSP